MWIQTTCGFFSIVEKPEDRAAGTLTVRARVKADLEALKAGFIPELGPIRTSQHTDYRHRAQAPRAAVSAGVGRAVAAIEYSNFKNAVAASQGYGRAEVYHEVWDALMELQLGEEAARASAGDRK